ncbi:hypothetical protein RFI_07946, partial [Reticulomyxa filosa]
MNEINNKDSHIDLLSLLNLSMEEFRGYVMSMQSLQYIMEKKLTEALLPLLAIEYMEMDIGGKDVVVKQPQLQSQTQTQNAHGSDELEKINIKMENEMEILSFKQTYKVWCLYLQLWVQYHLEHFHEAVIIADTLDRISLIHSLFLVSDIWHFKALSLYHLHLRQTTKDNAFIKSHVPDLFKSAIKLWNNSRAMFNMCQILLKHQPLQARDPFEIFKKQLSKMTGNPLKWELELDNAGLCNISLNDCRVNRLECQHSLFGKTDYSLAITLYNNNIQMQSQI